MYCAVKHETKCTVSGFTADGTTSPELWSSKGTSLAKALTASEKALSKASFWLDSLLSEEADDMVLLSLQRVEGVTFVNRNGAAPIQLHLSPWCENDKNCQSQSRVLIHVYDVISEVELSISSIVFCRKTGANLKATWQPLLFHRRHGMSEANTLSYF